MVRSNHFSFDPYEVQVNYGCFVRPQLSALALRGEREEKPYMRCSFGFVQFGIYFGAFCYVHFWIVLCRMMCVHVCSVAFSREVTFYVCA